MERRGEGPGRVDAHPRDGTGHRDEQGHQPSGTEPGVGREAVVVAHHQHHRHHHQRHQPFGRDGAHPAPYTRLGDDAAQPLGRRRPERGAEHQGHQAHPGGAAQDLGQHVAEGIGARQLPQPEERQGDRGVEMGAGALPPGGVDDRDGGEAHRGSHQQAACRVLGDPAGQGGEGREQQGGEGPGHHHEQTQPPRLDQHLRPVEFAHRPRSLLRIMPALTPFTSARHFLCAGSRRF